MRFAFTVICDIVILTVITLEPVILRGFGDPPLRGFYCNDETIRYPYLKSTVSAPTLYIVGVGIAVTIITLTEMVLAKETQSGERLMGIRLPSWIVNCYKFIGMFSFGAASVQVMAQGGAFTIGRLRPNFIDVCIPDVNCSSPDLQFKYIENYTCLGSAPEKIIDSRLSFPSGHATFASFASVFTVIYIQRRWNIKGFHSLKHFIQLVCIFLCWVTSLSRIHDYKHHWSDVVVGVILGTSIAVIACNLSFIYSRNDNNDRLPGKNSSSNEPAHNPGVFFSRSADYSLNP